MRIKLKLLTKNLMRNEEKDRGERRWKNLSNGKEDKENDCSTC